MIITLCVNKHRFDFEITDVNIGNYLGILADVILYKKNVYHVRKYSSTEYSFIEDKSNLELKEIENGIKLGFYDSSIDLVPVNKKFNLVAFIEALNQNNQKITSFTI